MYENNDKAQSTRRPKGSKGCFKILLKHTRLEDRKNRKDVLKLCQRDARTRSMYKKFDKARSTRRPQGAEGCIQIRTKHGRLEDQKEQKNV